ncbi:nucleotidyltransferase family protein [Agrobacterium vitis]|uniref:nucleotidyltransferase family protein n=1 Tax=Allorhizobium ampelinum TaxID=3025782 RepID=UPI001F459944|nr:nucleotidyltransferase family protein [Allorhizobium ampelinum]
MSDELHLELQAIVSKSPLLSPVLTKWDEIALPDSWLVAGAVAQTVWNHVFGFPPVYGIQDIDIVYFDPDDLSEDSEAEHSARIRAAFSGLPVWIDVKNQARVHSWYEAKFGYSINPYTSTAEAITTFPTTAAAVGLRPGQANLELCAPYGLSDLLSAVVRPNKKQITREIYEKKIDRWIKLWPELAIIGWDQ